MELCELTAISPLDGRYQNKLETLRKTLSEYGLIYYRVLVEVQWLIYLTNNKSISEAPTLNKQQLQFLENIVTDFNLKDAETIKSIEKTTNHDVKAVEYFLRDKINTQQDLKQLIPFIHFACTSEDINNLAYALMLKKSRDENLLPELNKMVDNLKSKANEYMNLAMLSRTHGQNATPTTLGKEFANVIARLQRQINQLSNQQILGKFNGAVGNYNAHFAAYPKVDWPSFNKTFVESLGLLFNPYTTQIEPHDYIAEYLQTLTRVNSIALDLARDIWAYISISYFTLRQQQHEVGSSTMPHKVNPIDFENAEGNLGIAIALGEHLALKLPISRMQRDLSDSTVLRNLGSVIGYSLLAYFSLTKGLDKIVANSTVIQADLNQCWEVLAEPIQTVMRRYGVADAYEQLKSLTRGKSITNESIREFIDQLDLPEDAKNALEQLTPENYIGYAVSLTQKISNN